MRMFHTSGLLRIFLGVLASGGMTGTSLGQAPAPTLERARWQIATPELQEDFPAVCLDHQGTPWMAYVVYNGKADTLRIAKKAEAGFEVIGDLAGPGVIHQPAVLCDGQGAIWTVWSEHNGDGAWQLKTRKIVDNKIAETTTVLDATSGNAVFSDAGADQSGRIWVVWQSFRKGQSDLFAKTRDPATRTWSDEMRITSDPAGDWEPRLAFGNTDAAWVVFDSSRGGDFNVHLATVQVNGKVAVEALSKTSRYEGRASVAAAPDGRGFWVAWENGRERWGRNSRGIDTRAGLNWGKTVDVGFYNAATKTFVLAPDATPVLKKVAKGIGALNLPCLGVDGAGTPWLAYRYFVKTHWRIGITAYDAKQKAWTRPKAVAASDFGQDRRCAWVRGKDGSLWLSWPSDKRKNKTALKSGVYLAHIDPAAKTPPAGAPAPKPITKKAPPARWADKTAERARDARHTWTLGGKKYGLYWGDFHRHTDVSNCRTPHDGCIVEQFRYAVDIGQLDFLGTSDHTDVGKIYDPYEWWLNQKLADVFQTPGFFNSFYVYEREQRWPWGHRNVVFIKRGAPIIYINRARYRKSPWNKTLPVANGGKEILPQELWKMLDKNGMDVSVISHTGATRMGTNWDGYDHIDHTHENLVEIFQGARVSYEGINTPQPRVGFPRGGKLKADKHGSVKTGRSFGKYNKGVYQNALRNGFNLGVFASSDHISTHASFGGVYTTDFSRKGILDAMNARRTIAATDKIYVEFTCNDRPMGSVFELTDKPRLQVSVYGTSKLARVTIVRNEANYKAFTPDSANFSADFTDYAPVEGMNRYYIRVEQQDGNMAWASPVWVTVKAAGEKK